MPSIGATTCRTRAAALTVSLGLHALVAWAVSGVEPPADPIPRTPPMTAYLLPLPPAPIEEPLPPVPEAPPIVEDETPLTPESEPEPERTPSDTLREPQDGPEPSTSSETRSEEAHRPTRSAPRRRNIDWSRSMSRAIARVREREQRSHRAFGRALPESDADRPGSDSTDRLKPWQSRRPGETITTGTQQVQVNESCYYEVYAPGSLLEEAHRFSNSMLSCRPSGPAEPRNDLFLDARPDYLDLHLAEESQSRP